jgi:hypothetical protein
MHDCKPPYLHLCRFAGVARLEAVCCMSQAHARLMARQQVTEQDAMVAAAIVEATMQQTSALSFLGALTAGFDGDPEAVYSDVHQRLVPILNDEVPVY